MAPDRCPNRPCGLPRRRRPVGSGHHRCHARVVDARRCHRHAPHSSRAAARVGDAPGGRRDLPVSVGQTGGLSLPPAHHGGPRRPCAQLPRRPAADNAPPQDVAASLAVAFVVDAAGARGADARPGRLLEDRRTADCAGRPVADRHGARSARRSGGACPRRSPAVHGGRRRRHGLFGRRRPRRWRRRPPPGRPGAAAHAGLDVDGGKPAPRDLVAPGRWVVQEGRVLQSRRAAGSATPGGVARTPRSCRRHGGGTLFAQPRWRTPPA